MTVEAFVNRLKVMVRYVDNIPFPGPDPPLVQQTKLKNIIFRPMPITWQTNFLCANGDVFTSSVLQLQQFMSQEREFAEQAQNLRGNQSGLNCNSNRNTQNRPCCHKQHVSGGRNNGCRP
jgi:hypothetical protein